MNFVKDILLNMNIEFTTSPSAPDIDFLTQKINQEILSFGKAYAFAFFIRDESNKIIAGCNRSVIFGSIYTKVPPIV